MQLTRPQQSEIKLAREWSASTTRVLHASHTKGIETINDQVAS
jgi:hypothetical protein